tara:strand:- start:341 stop:703 length:363 start_codon:yes stop_codon:yes gene_type:complete
MKIRADFVTNSSSASYIVMMDQGAYEMFSKMAKELRLIEPQDWTKLEWGVELVGRFHHTELHDVHALHAEWDHWPWQYLEPPGDIWGDSESAWWQDTSTDNLIYALLESLEAAGHSCKAD